MYIKERMRINEWHLPMSKKEEFDQRGEKKEYGKSLMGRCLKE